ncbi:MAG: 3-oxoacyl-[acyl-carrier-protein] synthase 2 [marine bacterium B5-7]|nr:MAG: 3-oxoacyl-[acyl-carrier-protein] synthase 2 [marine bacterium B5-7]
MSKRRVVVTGLGMVSPVGSDCPTSWQNLLGGVSGVDTIRSFDASSMPSRIAGEVKDFNPEAVLPVKELRKMDRFIQLGMVAGIEAIKDSGLDFSDEALALTSGVYIGAGIGGVGTIEKTTEAFLERGYKRVSPFYIPMSIINMVSGNLSILYGLKGPNLSMVTACSTGTHAIGEASRMIEYGDADVMVAGGTEGSVTPTAMAGFGVAKALSRNNDNPTAASRPWDIGRDGFVLGEGAGVLVLEEMEHAKRRGAQIYAELAGFGVSGDAHHMTQPAPGGEGASRCMVNAIRNAGLNTDQINYLNAHGTSTPLGDIAETLAIKRTFGDHAYQLAVSSIKSMIGHLLGAAGGVEAVTTALSVYHQVIPPTINLENQDPECDLDYVPGSAREMTIDAALSNSFGFGGTNGTLVFSRV